MYMYYFKIVVCKSDGCPLTEQKYVPEVPMIYQNYVYFVNYLSVFVRARCVLTAKMIAIGTPTST